MARDPYDDLDRRVEESYETRKGESTFHGIFRPNLNLPFWKASEGEHRGNIIPWLANEHNPLVIKGKLKVGQPIYRLEYYWHRNVGPHGLIFMCLQATIGKPCAVCEERQRLINIGQPEREADKEKYKKRLQFLKPKRRVAYNWECLDNSEEAEKGIQIMEIAHFCMEEPLMEQAKMSKVDGGGIISFAHPVRGKEIIFKRTGTGLENTRYSGHKFRDRKEPIPQDLLAEAFPLDTLFDYPSYEDVFEAFWDESAPEKKGDVEDAPSREGRANRAAVDSEPEPDLGEEDLYEPDEPGGEAQQEQEQLPRRGRASRAVSADEETPVERSTPFTVEDEATPPRRRPRSRGSEETTAADTEESAQHRRGRGKPQPVAVAEADTPTCPIPKGKFGETGDQFDECEGCDHWKPCVRETLRSK